MWKSQIKKNEMSAFLIKFQGSSSQLWNSYAT